MWGKKALYGRKFMGIVRSAFVVDEKGKLAGVFYKVSPKDTVPKAVAVLEKFATASKESPERTAAERAVADLRAGRKPVDDFKNLRDEVLDLQKQNRELRKELDDLKKKVEAAEAKPAESKSRKKPPGKK